VAYEVTLDDYRPAPRGDGRPWTQALIEEAAVSTGPWTPIETQPLSPIDPNPADPIYRMISTGQATLEHGWYRVTFIDETGNQDVTAPVFNGPSIRPSVLDISALLRARTRDENGNLIGLFTDDTTPMAEQVEDIIDDAVEEVTARLPDLPANRVGKARWLTKLYAALLIEATFFSEQIGSDKSPYQEFKDLYDGSMADLRADLGLGTGTGGGGTTAGRQFFGTVRLVP
jgi:hypothetical protein